MGFEYAFFIVSVPEGYIRSGLDISEEPSGFDVVLAWEDISCSGFDLGGGEWAHVFFTYDGPKQLANGPRGRVTNPDHS